MHTPRTIAVVGSGIAGLASAWLLSKKYQVTLYEKNEYIGGHTNTRSATFGDTTVFADTGFMVFNHRTYHNLVPFFEHLGVETVKTDMSFGITLEGGRFEFSSDNIFVQKRNMFRYSFWRMLFDIVRFNKEAERVVGLHNDEFPLRDLLKELKMSPGFAENYLLPMAGAIWSTGKGSILEYPAKYFVDFCENHGLLNPKTLNPFQTNNGRLQWYTVKNGANKYVEAVLSDMRAEILLDTEVQSITRADSGVMIKDTSGQIRHFDAVVCATHPDQTLPTLSEPTDDEKDILGAFSYSTSETTMHKDTSFMMRHTKTWPSWTYAEPRVGKTELSYYMNRLQHIDPSMPVIVTLNPTDAIQEKDVFYRATYEHPQFSVKTRHAQENIHTIQGTRRTYFAGAWLGHGFHEDGLVSALAVANLLGVFAPWQREK